MTYLPSRYGRSWVGLHNRGRLAGEIDQVVVDRLVAGHLVRDSSPAERAAAIATLARHGLSSRLIAQRTGLTTRTVERHRTRRLALYRRTA